jgi:phosphoribosylformylglycinamidine synthase
MYQVELIVKPRTGVFDPQATAVEEALHGAGWHGLNVQCVGRFLSLRVQAASEAEARAQAQDMCRRLLVNPSLETAEITVKAV